MNYLKKFIKIYALASGTLVGIFLMISLVRFSMWMGSRYLGTYGDAIGALIFGVTVLALYLATVID